MMQTQPGIAHSRCTGQPGQPGQEPKTCSLTFTNKGHFQGIP